VRRQCADVSLVVPSAPRPRDPLQLRLQQQWRIPPTATVWPIQALSHFPCQTNQLVCLEEALYRPTVEARAVCGMRIARLNCERAIRGFDVCLLKTEPVSSMSVRFQRSVTFSSHVGDTGKRLPGLSVGPPRSVLAVGCLLMSALSRRRYARHTVTPAVCTTKHG